MINMRDIVYVTTVGYGPTYKSESIKAKDLVVGDFILYHGNWHYVANNWYCAQSSYAKLNLIAATEFDVKGMKSVPLATKIPLNEHVTIRSREEQAMLAMQNAIEECRNLEQCLLSHMGLHETLTHPDGTVSLVNSNISIPKDMLVKASRDVLKASGSKLAEMLKKV